MLNKNHPDFVARMKGDREALVRGIDACNEMLSSGRVTDDQLHAVKDASERALRYKGIDPSTVKGTPEWQRRAAASDALMAQIGALGAPEDGMTDPEEVTQQKANLARAIRTKSPYRAEIPRKALETGPLNLPALGTTAVGAQPGTAAVALRDLFPTIATTSPLVRYYQVGPVTGGPDVVAENALKPDMVSSITPKDAAMVKLAGKFVHTMEMDEDAPQLVAEVLRQALLTLVRRENKLVLDTMAAASGIVVKSGTFATALDVIAGEIGAQESINGITPDAVIANPVDLAKFRTVKSTGSGEYALGDPSTAGAKTLWGIPVMATPALEAGTVWLSRKDAGQFYQRSGVAIISAPSGDDLDYNRVTTVVEERVLPVITQPGLLTRITLT